jgi:hypothetical protein
MPIVSPHNRFKSLGPKSLPRSPAFQGDGELQARLFAQTLDAFATVLEGLQKIFAIKLNLCQFTACKKMKMVCISYHNPQYDSLSFKHIKQQGKNMQQQ